MNNIEEVYQFNLRFEEKLSRKFDNKNSGRGCNRRYGRRSYESYNDDQKNKDEARSSNLNQMGSDNS